jgi:fructokinase
MKLAAVEGGGTSFVVAIGTSPTEVLERAEFKTTTPEETLGKCCAWLKERVYDALGVASFGPVDLQMGSPTYGHITTTPKPGWKNTDILGPLLKVRKVPVVFDTDVNAPALAEYLHAKNGNGPDANITSCAYITVGTGIGVGLVVNGAPVTRRPGPRVTEGVDNFGRALMTVYPFLHPPTPANSARASQLVPPQFRPCAEMAVMPCPHPPNPARNSCRALSAVIFFLHPQPLRPSSITQSLKPNA